MKSILLFTFLTIPYLNFYSQHQTTFNSNGDPLSEIIDADNMKQGTWNLYNSNGDIIRVEKYKDNQLLSRESLVSKTMLNTVKYRCIPIKVTFHNEIKQIDSNCTGEFLINESGDIISIHFYAHSDENTQKVISDKILSSYETKFTNVIITF